MMERSVKVVLSLSKGDSDGGRWRGSWLQAGTVSNAGGLDAGRYLVTVPATSARAGPRIKCDRYSWRT